MSKQRIIEILDITDTISKTFCLAKWHHTTIYLQSGETHSCYHPAPHTIPLDELEHNPSALHNTRQKKNERNEMLIGGEPKGCQYCWNIEALGDDYISDRKERNSTIYTPERFAKIKNDPLGNVNPQYIEISFGNECNFKCGYCHPKASSAYYKEIKTHGRYPVKNHGFGIEGLTIYEEETNPYVKAWWDWWPEVRKTLTILRITGGEPLLQQSTWRLLDDLDKNPLPNLELNINSNFGVKPILIDRLSEKVNNLVSQGKIKDFKIFTSIDTWGPQAEYIRTGLDLTVWEKNLDTYLTKTSSPVTFMITFNILSVPNFQQLLEKILEWREKYKQNDQRFRRIGFDTPYLKEPLQYDMNILPKEDFMPYMHKHLQFMKDNMDSADRTKFDELEYEKFRRVVDYMRETVYPDARLEEGRKDFYVWFNEYDKRRGTDFSSTFPELVKFYKDCYAMA
jgi:sulfatase maturation enzyme AslB (radical SAM superfamily)